MISTLLAASGGFWSPIANPLSSVLAFFYDLIPNYGIAIVLLTVAMMVVLTPLTIKQTRSMLVMQKLQPEMKRLQAEHKNDRQALNEAVMALYKEHNASPLGGCLPMLLPFPLFIALLKVLEGLSRMVRVGTGKTARLVSSPKYLSSTTAMYKNIVKGGGKLNAFGMDLAKAAKSAGGGFGHELPYFVLLLLMVGTQFYQQYQMTSKNPAMSSQPGQAMMMKLVPIIFGIFSLEFPAGVVVYWTVSNIIRIGTQWALYRYDPKVKALVVQDIKEVEAKTREIDERQSKSKSKQASSSPASTATTSGRPRLRDLLNDASKAAAERRGGAAKNAARPDTKDGGKGAARPDSRAGGDKGSGVRGGTASGAARAGKPGSPGAAKGGGAQKAVQPRSPAKPGPGKPGPAKAGAPRAGTPKPGGPAKPGSAKSVAPKGGAGKPGATKSVAPSGTPQRGTAAKNGAGLPVAGTPARGAAAKNGAGAPSESTNASPKPASPKPDIALPAEGALAPRQPKVEVDGVSAPAEPSAAPMIVGGDGTDLSIAVGANGDSTNGDSTNGDSTNGDSTGGDRTSGDGNDDGTESEGIDAAEVAGAAAVPGASKPTGGASAAKGRTGGGSARNVNSTRRRKGR